VQLIFTVHGHPSLAAQVCRGTLPDVVVVAAKVLVGILRGTKTFKLCWFLMSAGACNYTSSHLCAGFLYQAKSNFSTCVSTFHLVFAPLIQYVTNLCMNVICFILYLLRVGPFNIM
jgi:hypothetical protein